MKTYSTPRLEVFLGAGGVGKTTLAVSRAMYLASQDANRSVLILTIDPAKRLKHFLGEDANPPNQLANLHHFNYQGSQHTLWWKVFDALLFIPPSIREKISGKRILQNLFSSNGGLEEILSVVMLSKLMAERQYHTVILDTPPGGHFIDFIQSVNKIHSFFQSKYLKLVTQLVQRPLSISGKITQWGMERFLQLLKTVTGESFISEFVESLSTIFEFRHFFIEAASSVQSRLNDPSTRYFQITSADRSDLNDQPSTAPSGEPYLVINKSLTFALKDFQSETPEVNAYCQSILQKEADLIHHYEKFPGKILLFPEQSQHTPSEQLPSLITLWENQGIL